MISRHFYAIAGLVAVLSAISFSSTHAHKVAASGTAPVLVMNTTSSPVPTVAQGTTTIAGSVSVDNTASSPVPVSVQGTASVEVSNGVNAPIPVHIVREQRVEGSNSADINDGDLGANVPLTSVPLGKSLIITDISVHVSTGSGQHIPSVHVFGLGNGDTFQHFITLFATGPDSSGGDNFSGSLDGTALKFDGNSNVFVSVIRSDSSGGATVIVTYAGYLE